MDVNANISTGNYSMNDGGMMAKQEPKMISSPYLDCGSELGTILGYYTETCTIDDGGQRCRFNRYETGPLAIVFQLNEPVNQLSVSGCGKADISFFDLFPCLSQDVIPSDACQVLPCPLRAGTIYNMRFVQKSPTSMLNLLGGMKDIRSTIDYQLTDEQGRIAICLTMKLILT